MSNNFPRCRKQLDTKEMKEEARIAIAFRRTVTLGVTLAALLVGSSTAEALPYDGTDPVGTGCSRSAITARSAVIREKGGSRRVFGEIQLRYSRVCRTTWAKVVHYYQDCVPADRFCGYAKVTRNSDGYSPPICSIESFVYAGRARRSCYTPQVNDAGVTSYAFGSLDNGFYSGEARTSSF